DFAIMKLICASGIPLAVVRLAEWKEVFKIASPNYIPASASTIEGSQIPAEASRVRQEQVKLLEQEYHLTLSFDGGSIRHPQSVETIHVTTADWESFLVQGHEASDVSHTADHVENVIVEVIDSIGVEHFSAIASDGASNAKKPRLSVCKQHPTLIGFHDAAHATNLPCKDISKLSIFVGTIKEIQQVLSHFKHSTISTTLLTITRADMDLGQGLESIGKTRFATICWAALSVQRCLPAIRHLVSTKQKVNHLFIEQSSSALRFEFSLNRLIMILLPFAKAILCFEAAHVTASDVYVFWLAITASIKDVIDDPENDIDEQTACEIRGIINYCFRELFQEPHGDVYVVAFYLDPREPCFLGIGLCLTSLTALHDPNDPTKTPYFRHVGNYLGTLLQNEFARKKRHPSLAGLSAATVSSNFKAQFASYAREQFPFANPVQEDQSVLDWWRVIADHPLANMLSFVAIKLFSVLPSSMADEWTMSTFT
ncbi:hypothetical protein K439DRAFT_1293915, partial [Ramaria rubella]